MMCYVYRFRLLAAALAGTLLMAAPAGAQPFVHAGTDMPAMGDSAAEWGDYDGDGDLDLVLSGKTTDGDLLTIVYRNDGDTDGDDFVDFIDIGADLPGTERGSVAWGDYDGDGDLDLVLTGNAAGGAIAAIYRNEGDINGDGFAAFVDIGADLDPVERGEGAWGDYDGDGDLDLLTIGHEEDARLYTNDGGAFSHTDAGVSFADGETIDWGDYDADGDLDIVFAGERDTDVFRNDGTDGFTLDEHADLQDIDHGTARWGDYDGDGDLDLVVAGLADGVPDALFTALYRNVEDNDGDGFRDFQEVGAGLVPVARASADWGDYDGDGDLDLVVAGTDDGTAGGNLTVLYENDFDGGSGFVDAAERIEAVNLPAAPLLAGVRRGASTFGDYDGDGDLDLFVSGNEQAIVYENRYTGAPPRALATALVFRAERIEFESAGAAITFTPGTSFGRVYVSRYDAAPADSGGLSGGNVNAYRIVVDADASLSVGEGSTLHVAAEAVADLTDPADVVVYARPVAGRGAFTALPTSYDAAGGEMIAEITGFGEFVLATGDALTSTGPVPPPAAPYVLSQVYPNPARHHARFALRVRTTQTVQVEVLDVLGRRVALLHNAPLQGDTEYRFVFDSAGLPSGSYFIRLRGDGFAATKQVAVLK